MGQFDQVQPVAVGQGALGGVVACQDRPEAARGRVHAEPVGVGGGLLQQRRGERAVAEHGFEQGGVASHGPVQQRPCTSECDVQLLRDAEAVGGGHLFEEVPQPWVHGGQERER